MVQFFVSLFWFFSGRDEFTFHLKCEMYNFFCFSEAVWSLLHFFFLRSMHFSYYFLYFFPPACLNTMSRHRWSWRWVSSTSHFLSPYHSIRGGGFLALLVVLFLLLLLLHILYLRLHRHYLLVIQKLQVLSVVEHQLSAKLPDVHHRRSGQPVLEEACPQKRSGCQNAHAMYWRQLVGTLAKNNLVGFLLNNLACAYIWLSCVVIGKYGQEHSCLSCGSK